MHKILPACLVAGLIGLAATPAFADLSAADRDFLLKAASGGMAEIQVAQLAQQRASSQQVRQFATRMITDHTQINAALQQIAEEANIELPTQPTGKDAMAGRRLSGLNGTAFDQAYSQAELLDHQQDVALFRKEANSGQDPALKAFAQDTLPTMLQHLQLAQALSTAR
jgi:putative membrane protein